MASLHESELELELEQALHEAESEGEGELELEGEGEGFLGAIGNVLGGLLGESELEGEGEFELEGEGEFELEGEGEFELENGEQFFGGIKRLIKRAAPMLKRVARFAVPMVAKAIGGPFGGIVGNVAGQLLKEGELEFELEGEGEFEFEHEAAHEVAHEIAEHELTEHEALAELMAAHASQEAHEGEAEAMAGAAATTVISPADRRALRMVLPHMVRGTAILTRILRRNRLTRPAVRAVPTIVRRSVNTLRRQAAAGRPITRKAAARATAMQVRRVLGNPTACAAAIARNVRTARAVARPRRARAISG
jgi:hypothetical protein